MAKTPSRTKRDAAKLNELPTPESPTRTRELRNRQLRAIVDTDGKFIGIEYPDGSQQLGELTLATRNLTGRIRISAAGQPLLQPVGMDYTTVLLPLAQSGGASVLPTDYSGLNVPITFGASTDAPWANAGYFTSVAGAGNKSLVVPNSAVALNLSADSFVVGFTLNKAVPAGSDTIAGCSDGGAIPGIYLIVSSTGKLGARLFCNGGTALSATYSAATVADGTDHRVLVTFNAPTKTVSIYVDGAVSFSGAAAAILGTDIMTGAFSLGRSATGNTVDGKFAGFEYLRFPASGLPKNIAELASQDNARRFSGVFDLPVFL